MAILDPQALRQQAADRLQAASNQKKLVLIFACVSAGLALAAGVVSMILDGQIAGTGGLGGLQLRSVLTTLQAMLNFLLLTFIPFWNLGYTSVVLKLGRGEAASEQDLLGGFRRFGPGLRLLLLRMLVYFALAFAAVQVASIVLSLTPWANTYYQQMMTIDLTAAQIDDATMEAMTQAMLPVLIVAGVLYLVALVPVTYRLRLAEYRLMDEPKCGALLAMLQSNHLMKGHCVAMFKLDLGFWWYYLASVLIPVICYGDVLLPLAGVQLPFDPTVSFFLFYVLAQAAQVALYWCCRNQIECAYVGAYDTLLSQLPPPAQPAQTNPWRQ